jgi:hypothetical protein
LQDPDNLRAVYGKLTDRQRLIANLLNETNKQRGLPTYDKIDLLITLQAWQKILKSVPTYALDHCFTQAVTLHPQRYPNAPFQAAEVAQVWSEASESTRQQLFEQTGIKTLEAGLCEWCNGYGKMRVIVHADEGRKSYTPVKWASPEDTNTMVICDCKTVGQAE